MRNFFTFTILIKLITSKELVSLKVKLASKDLVFMFVMLARVSLKLLLASLSGNLSSPTVLEKKLLKTRHSSSSFEIVLFPSVKFISSLFENLFKKSGTKNFPSTVTLLLSKLSI